MNNIENPLVSVVLITYNSSKYVLETLESVKNQTWNNIELIVSDDGSTDQTLEICSNWLTNNSSCFNRTQLISVPENTGIPSNCNRGLRAAKGEWLKTISGDDILLENCLSDNIEFSRKFPDASFIVSDLNQIDENSDIITEKAVNEGLIYFANISSVKNQLKAYIRWPIFLNVPSFFCKKEIVQNIGYCDENFWIYEDTTMVIRLLEKGVKPYYMKKPTVAYRIHLNSISRNEKMNNKREIEAYKIFQKYRLKHLNFFNPFDVSVYYESWLRFKYKGLFGYKGVSILRKFSFYYWFMRLNGVKTY
ncbi:MAG: glycosyltransferase [Fermentimonas sp.]|nr:glycosyltransferase [Fermentimonas sp.]